MMPLMVLIVSNHRRVAGLALAALIAAASPARAQLDLQLELGGSRVGVGVGGNGVGLDVELGDTSLGVQLGGSDGLGLDVDLGLGLGGGNGSGSARLGVDEVLSQERALEAVRQRRALPLEDILLRTRVITDAEVIDARLISVNATLLYEVKVLGKAGDVSKLYFYARSGAPVNTN